MQAGSHRVREGVDTLDLWHAVAAVDPLQVGACLYLYALCLCMFLCLWYIIILNILVLHGSLHGDREWHCLAMLLTHRHAHLCAFIFDCRLCISQICPAPLRPPLSCTPESAAISIAYLRNLIYPPSYHFRPLHAQSKLLGWQFRVPALV